MPLSPRALARSARRHAHAPALALAFALGACVEPAGSGAGRPGAAPSWAGERPAPGASLPEASPGAAPSPTGCVPAFPEGVPATSNDDALSRLLAAGEGCPPDVMALRERLLAGGARLATALVNNRGYHSAEGSYSLFEAVRGRVAGREVGAGEFFFGHFTAAEGTLLRPDQATRAGNLMVEAIAWDGAKAAFNFFELVGDGARGRWHYRGDSRDVARDVALLHREAGGGAPFGRALRCSGCHLNGGPILKELDAPHNDWWTQARPLPFGGRKPDGALAAMLVGLVDADAFAADVREGSRRLEAAPGRAAFRREQSVPERLRPLFCPHEINLVSDDGAGGEGRVSVPAASLVDPRLGAGQLAFGRAHYEAALGSLGARFEGTGRRDGDHAWLAPAKAYGDVAAVEAALRDGLIDEELVLDVLAVDFTNPALSSERCALLRHLPERAEGDVRAALLASLGQARDPAARALADNLRDPARDAASHRARAARFFEACARRSGEAGFVRAMTRLLAQRRAEIAANAVSKSPRGQILEPGFRVIFPTTETKAVPGALRLSEACEVVGAAGGTKPAGGSSLP